MSHTCGEHGWRHALDLCPRCVEANVKALERDWETNECYDNSTELIFAMRTQRAALIAKIDRLRVALRLIQFASRDYDPSILLLASKALKADGEAKP